MNASVKKSVKILKKAMELIVDKDRWTVGSCHRNGSFCLIGAVDYASGTSVEKLDTYEYHTRHKNTPHDRALIAAIGKSRLYAFNDTHQHHEVLAALHNAIDLLEAGVVK